MHPMLNIAVRAARKAGNLIAKNYETSDAIAALQQGSDEFIAKVNHDAEHLVIETIRKSYPKHSIISEEQGEQLGEHSDIQWIITPLDSKANFTKRLPHFATSLAVQIKGRTEVAVVYDSMRNELFSAARGQGAQLNGYRIRSNNAKDLNAAMLATDFPFNAKQYTPTYLKIIEKLLTQCSHFRFTGSAALDLAYVASGRVDGYFILALKPWEFIAGELLVREAGGLLTDFSGGHDYLKSGNIVAGNPKVVKTLLANMRDILQQYSKTRMK